MRSMTPAAIAFALAMLCACAQQNAPGAQPSTGGYSPYPDQSFPNRAYFGDTYLQTSYSADAGMIGNTLGPDEAYRFARGEVVTSSTGIPARLQRPLEFGTVIPHARVARRHSGAPELD